MKRILSVVLLLALLATFVPSMPITAKAANRWDVINTGKVTGQDIAARAEYYIGAGRYDGSDYKERTGFGSKLHFDCSGFVYRVLRDLDLGSTQPNASIGQKDPNGNYFEGKNSAGYYYITANTQQQRYYGTQLSTAVSKYKQTGDYSGFEPGDLMVFSYNGGASVSHMAIYVGDGKVVHSTSSKGVYKTALSQTGWPNGKLGNSLIDANRLVTHNHSLNSQGVCTECGKEYDYEGTKNTATSGYYSVSAGSGISLYEKPYTAASKLSGVISKNTEVEVLGEVTNASGETWYQTKYNGVTGYTLVSNLTLKGYFAQNIQCNLKTPTQDEIVPQASYNLTGTITSQYPLAEVSAYLDGALVTTIQLGEATSLDIKSSAINQKLSFGKLTPGAHTLVIKARDIHRDSLVTVCERKFKTECDHNYSSKVTGEATCETDGVRTYTCSVCSDSYTEVIPGGHTYTNGACSRCGAEEPEITITCDLTSPAEGAIVPKASYNVLGEIKSEFPLALVEAYLDGNCFASIALGEAYTLDIRTSAINKNLSFSKLASGSHTLIIKARDIYHSEMSIVCTRRFVTEGAVACQHNYQSAVTQEPTCEQVGITTYTCSLCGDSYTEQIQGGHVYEDGICMECGNSQTGNYLFPDVHSNAWYYKSVEFAVEKGYFSGNGDGTFGPGNNITRQDFVVVLSRIAGANLSQYSGKTSFTDVPANAYYAKAIHWATDNGIISGYNSTTFGVGDSLTREQLVTILSRYAQKKGVNVTPTTAAQDKMNTYSDANKINPYMKNAVAWALQNKVINGMTSTTIAPQGNATRAQVAAILMNINAYKVIPGI